MSTYRTQILTNNIWVVELSNQGPLCTYVYNLEQLNGSYVECERVQKLDNYVGHYCEIFDGSFYTVPIKFGLSEKHTKLEKIFLMVCTFTQ